MRRWTAPAFVAVKSDKANRTRESSHPASRAPSAMQNTASDCRKTAEKPPQFPAKAHQSGAISCIAKRLSNLCGSRNIGCMRWKSTNAGAQKDAPKASCQMPRRGFKCNELKPPRPQSRSPEFTGLCRARDYRARGSAHPHKDGNRARRQGVAETVLPFEW